MVPRGPTQPRAFPTFLHSPSWSAVSRCGLQSVLSGTVGGGCLAVWVAPSNGQGVAQPTQAWVTPTAPTRRPGAPRCTQPRIRPSRTRLLGKRIFLLGCLLALKIRLSVCCNEVSLPWAHTGSGLPDPTGLDLPCTGRPRLACHRDAATQWTSDPAECH